MHTKIHSGIVLMLLLTSILSSALIIQPVEAAGGTIYIRADGSIDPPTAPIQREGDLYTFTDNIYDSVVVERDNILIDGVGYTLQGTERDTAGNPQGAGIGLAYRLNVTIKNVKVIGFHIGFELDHSYYNTLVANIVENHTHGMGIWGPSGSNLMHGNIVINNSIGIHIWGSSDNLVSTNIIANNSRGIFLHHGSEPQNNTICGNDITSNEAGVILLDPCDSNTFFANNITANNLGMGLFSGASNNIIYHNNFVDNTQQVDVYTLVNVWDDGYPSGGNYWSNYEARYPDASEIDDSGIWDTPYVIDENNQDNYPLLNPWTPTPEVGIEIIEPQDGDVFWIDAEPEPKMPTITCLAKVVGITPDPTTTTRFLWKGKIRYTEYGRDDLTIIDPTKTLGGSWTPDFRNVIAGGEMEIEVTAVINGKSHSDRIEVHLRGRNPDATLVKDTLGQLILQAICYKECWPGHWWYQFHACAPRYGLPEHEREIAIGGGWGLMQITWEPDIADIWSWKQNILTGKETFRHGKAFSRKCVKYFKAQYPEDRSKIRLSVEQHEEQASHYYNRGGLDGYYWLWDPANERWTINPAVPRHSETGLTYAQEVMRIVSLVKNATPPEGWGS